MTDPALRIALVEDHDLLRALLVEHLEREDDLVLTACVGTAAEARQQITPGSADVAVLDVGLPDGDGIALGIALQQADPGLRVLLLSAEAALAPMLVSQRQASTPWSFLSKRSALATDHLAETLREVADGRVVIDPAEDGDDRRQHRALARLSATQSRVLRLVASGLTNNAVAVALGLAPKSVEAALSTIYRQLGVSEDQNPRVATVLAYQRHAEQAERTDAP